MSPSFRKTKRTYLCLKKQFNFGRTKNQYVQTKLFGRKKLVKVTFSSAKIISEAVKNVTFGECNNNKCKRLDLFREMLYVKKEE